MSEQALCWMNGQLKSAATATVSVFDHGLLYGDGVFEGIRFYRRRPFRLADHLERLELSARAIALPLSYDRQVLAAAVAEIIAAYPSPDGYLRVVATRGIGSLGLDPRSCRQPTLFIIADRLNLLNDVRQRGAKVMIAATRRLAADGLDPRIKSLNYLNPILARMEANQAGADEAILLNGAGRVAEGTADNIFVVRRGQLLTPPASEGALAGVTRAVVIELAIAAGIPVAEMPLTLYDLYGADECFLTGTAAELVPVAEIGGRAVGSCPGSLFLELERRFRELIEFESADEYPGAEP